MSDFTAIRPLLVKPQEAAAILSISPRKLARITREGGLRAVKIGRCVRYDPADLADWIARQKGQVP
jgi:excisionase family DNA binding protein